MRRAGMGKIVLFNWPWYAGGALACVAAMTGLRCGVAGSCSGLIALATAVSAFWLLSSLVVSHHVYDRSPLAAGRWLAGAVSPDARRVAVFHAGHDEISEAAARVLPAASIDVFDFYDARSGATASLRRARAAARGVAIPVGARALPLTAGCLDLGLIVFAAHEIRDRGARVAFFAELARVLAASGRALVVEHLRDGWNFAAFGPGAFHFFSRRVWRRDLAAGGLRVRREWRCTPFVRVFEVTAK